MAFDLLLAALMFGTVAALDLSGWRVEIIAALLTELPVVFVVSWVCLAQAGRLPSTHGTLPVEPAARHPWLRTVLGTAPLSLLLAWGLAAVIGLVWPSPAMHAYAPAPPQFFLFKWTIMVPEGFYSALAAVIFLIAARSSASALRLRMKNLAFSVGTFCLALIALGSMVFAGVRLWGSEESRRAILETLNTLETCLAIMCLLAFAFGLTLRYTPAIADTLLRRFQTGWLLAQERFESLKWRAVTAGRARGVFRASHHVAAAANLQGLSGSDTEKALATIQLVAVMQDPSSETERITPETTRELYELQEQILRDDTLASKISWATSWGSHASESQTVKSAPLHDALKAALELVDYHNERAADVQARPLWYHLVAVSAADARLIDPARIRAQLGRQQEHRVALEAYHAAKNLSRSLTLDDHQREVDHNRRRART